MNPEHEDDLVDLGSASSETKGGPMGFEDSERTYWLNGAGLAQD
jgi:hypothetical protein